MYAVIFAGNQAPAVIAEPEVVPDKPEIVLDVSLQARIHRLVPQLVTILELDYGLPGELLSLGILNDMQVDHVEGGVNIYERINRLLEYFKNESDDVCEQFLTSLRNTKQHHVVKYIELDGG